MFDVGKRGMLLSFDVRGAWPKKHSFPGGPGKPSRRTAMTATQPTPLSYDVFVSDGPAGAGDDLMPDGAPLAWSPLPSTLVSGGQDALLVDPPFTRGQIQAVGDWVERSGRRLAYIYVTHGHGDHRVGTGELVKRFPGVTVYATDGTIEVMRQQAGQGRARLSAPTFPGHIPATPLLA